MSISDICKNKAITISKDETIQHAAKLMRDNAIGSIVVTQNEEGEEVPIGIVTDRDIAIKAVAEKTSLKDVKVSHVMCKDLLVIEDDQDINDAIETMEAKKVRRAPIINEEGEICGIVSLDDLLVYMAKGLTKLAGLVEKQIKG